MGDPARLVELFLAALPHGDREAAGAPEELGALLQRGCEGAAAARPGLGLPEEELIRWVAARVGRSPAQALVELRWADLLLACACAQGLPRALEAFEKDYFHELETALSRLSAPPVSADDLGQILREKLFLPRGAEPPRIAEYSGRGELRNWVRVVLARTLVDLSRSQREVPVPDEQMADLMDGPLDDPELEHLKRTYRAQLREVFREAFARLARGDRLLLRYRFTDAMTLEQLAVLYDVDRTTVIRRLGRARQALMDQLRPMLATRLKITPSELPSILGLVESQLDLTLGDRSSVGEG